MACWNAAWISPRRHGQAAQLQPVHQALEVHAARRILGGVHLQVAVLVD